MSALFFERLAQQGSRAAGLGVQAEDRRQGDRRRQVSVAVDKGGEGETYETTHR